MIIHKITSDEVPITAYGNCGARSLTQALLGDYDDQEKYKEFKRYLCDKVKEVQEDHK